MLKLNDPNVSANACDKIVEFIDQFNKIFTPNSIEVHPFLDLLKSIAEMDNVQYIDMLKLLQMLFVS